MLLGEMCLLVAAVLVMTGLAKKITARLYINDFIATFSIFLIVLLNVRGGIGLGRGYALYLGGALSVLLSFYAFIRRTEKPSDALFGIIGCLTEAGIAFLYTYVFSSVWDAGILAFLLSILSGVWCALVSKRTFASCLFAANVGGFIGITLYLIFVKKGGEIGGTYTFAVMWMSAIFGLLIQHLLALTMRAVNSPRAQNFFEAGEMRENEEKSDENKEDQFKSSAEERRKRS